jgi:hypothetical protein
VHVSRTSSSKCETRRNVFPRSRNPNAILGLFDTPAGNVTVASGFAAGAADLVIDVTGWWR